VAELKQQANDPELSIHDKEDLYEEIDRTEKADTPRSLCGRQRNVPTLGRERTAESNGNPARPRSCHSKRRHHDRRRYGYLAQQMDCRRRTRRMGNGSLRRTADGRSRASPRKYRRNADGGR
jgi:hypothetical protein